MRLFNNYNPLFGRKKIKFILEYTSDFKRKIKGKIIEFDDNHITFNNIGKQNKEFLTDHLKINDNSNAMLTNNADIYMALNFTNINLNGVTNNDEEKEEEITDAEDAEDHEDDEDDEDEEKEQDISDDEEKEEDYDY
jgi:hypothetical protein